MTRKMLSKIAIASSTLEFMDDKSLGGQQSLLPCFEPCNFHDEFLADFCDELINSNFPNVFSPNIGEDIIVPTSSEIDDSHLDCMKELFSGELLLVDHLNNVLDHAFATDLSTDSPTSTQSPSTSEVPSSMPSRPSSHSQVATPLTESNSGQSVLKRKHEMETLSDELYDTSFDRVRKEANRQAAAKYRKTCKQKAEIYDSILNGKRTKVDAKVLQFNSRFNEMQLYLEILESLLRGNNAPTIIDCP